MPLNLTGLRGLKARILDATEEAARETILAKAQEYIPKDTDTADKSGRVVRDGNRVVVTFGSDSDSNPKTGQSSNTYIEALHENLAAHHENGIAKFLQRAGDEASGTLAAAVARKVRG